MYFVDEEEGSRIPFYFNRPPPSPLSQKKVAGLFREIERSSSSSVQKQKSLSKFLRPAIMGGAQSAARKAERERLNKMREAGKR